MLLGERDRRFCELATVAAGIWKSDLQEVTAERGCASLWSLPSTSRTVYATLDRDYGGLEWWRAAC